MGVQKFKCGGRNKVMEDAFIIFIKYVEKYEDYNQFIIGILYSSLR